MAAMPTAAPPMIWYSFQRSGDRASMRFSHSLGMYSPSSSSSASGAISGSGTSST